MHKEFPRRTEKNRAVRHTSTKEREKREIEGGEQSVMRKKVLPIGPNFYGPSSLMKQPRGFSPSSSVATFLLSDYT